MNQMIIFLTNKTNFLGNLGYTIVMSARQDLDLDNIVNEQGY